MCPVHLFSILLLLGGWFCPLWYCPLWTVIVVSFIKHITVFFFFTVLILEAGFCNIQFPSRSVLQLRSETNSGTEVWNKAVDVDRKSLIASTIPHNKKTHRGVTFYVTAPLSSVELRHKTFQFIKETLYCSLLVSNRVGRAHNNLKLCINTLKKSIVEIFGGKVFLAKVDKICCEQIRSVWL